MISVLYDGWPLIYQPNSPAALHLLALLSALSAQVEACLALPGAAPAWLPERVQVASSSHAEGQHLRWEQRELSRLARQCQARLAHLTTPGPALFSPVSCLISPVDYTSEAGNPARPAQGLMGHLKAALAEGGQSRLAARLWPSDLPAPSGPMTPLSPFVAPLFPEPLGSQPGNLPETYILYHGPSHNAALLHLLDAWSWAAAAIGEQVSLVCLGFDAAGQSRLEALRDEYPLVETIKVLPAVPTPAVPTVYARAAAVFHPFDDVPWGGPVRHGIAYHRPVVAAESPRNDALAGPAAYLAPPDDARMLGAALITVIVEESVSERLVEAAAARSAPWDNATIAEELESIYQQIL